MRSTTKLLHNFLILSKRNIKLFSQENQKKGITNFLKEAWKQTFPKQQDQVKRKHNKTKQIKRYSAQQLSQMQGEIPQYKRTALVETQQKPKQENKKFTISKLIPESLKNKIKQSQSYKEFTDFKQNLKQYASTRDGAIANAGTYVYSQVSTGSNLARATQLMRKYDPQFTIFDLEKQSTFIFLDAYHKFMAADTEEIQKIAAEQALEYFKAYIKMNKVKECHPKYNQFLHYYPATLKDAKIGQRTLPIFSFQMKTMEIYCMLDKNGKIIDGSDERILESVYEFSMEYGGNYLDDLGHPWQITEIRKIQQLKLLV